jgi:4'-phosphopantetheinyl transferase EntD
LAGVTLEVAIDLSLAHGRCVGLRLPERDDELQELEQSLHPAERALTAGFGTNRRRTWIGGRVAMRQALLRAAIDAPPVLANSRGAPQLPPGVSGSISHKAKWAIALVAREPVARVGVDVEDDVVRAHDISRRVLRDEELTEVAELGLEARAREVLLRFSAKEALYKALDPFVQRYVGFREVAVSPEPGGGARVVLHLTGGEGPFVVEIRWMRLESLVLTTARVTKVQA